MKKIYTKRRFSFAAVMVLSTISLLSVLMYACKKPTDGIKIIIDSSLLFPAPTVIKFSNADSTSANQLNTTAIAVSISGPGAHYVQNADGDTSSFTTSNGLLALALTKGANPSPTNPIVFTVSANVTGFAPIVQTITITKNALSVFNIKALEYAKPPAGTSTFQDSTTYPLSAGNLVDQHVLTTSTSATMTEKATLTFQANTQMLNAASGSVINASLLKLKVVNYGTATDAAKKALPGGLTASSINGITIPGGVNFVAAGLLQLNLTADNTPVKGFSQPVSAVVELNPGLKSFPSGSAIQVGDLIPLWSIDEATGLWKSEGNATVISSNGKLAAKFNITHLSCWSLDWSWTNQSVPGSGLPASTVTSCGSDLNVTVNTSNTAFSGGPYEISLQTTGGDYISTLQGVTISNGYVATFTNVPNLANAKVVVNGGIPYTHSQTIISNTCTAGAVTVNVSTPTAVPPYTPVNVALDITGICSGKDITILPSATFELYQQSGSVFVDAGTLQLVNGKGNTILVSGLKYYFVTTYNNTVYKIDPFLITKSSFVTSASSGFTVNATYDAPTNTLLFKGTIPVNCN